MKENAENHVIETERTWLRPFMLKDVKPFAKICHDPEVMRYIGSGPHNEDITYQKIRKWCSDYERDGFGLFAIIYKKDHALIGFCGLIPQIIDRKKYFELAYRLAKKYWRQGIVTEVASQVLDYAFNILDITELISIIHKDNIAAQNLAKKIGMKPLKRTLFAGIEVDVFIKPQPPNHP
jgi:ribosomal-protein-alanine N-acetyltransferase